MKTEPAKEPSLPQRLRWIADIPLPQHSRDSLLEAADRIEVLEAENLALRVRLKEYQQDWLYERK